MKMKDRLGLALKEFMASENLDEISVVSLTNYCNVNRQTFYYHFRNIYDLLTWVFLNEKIEKPSNNELEEGLLIILQYIKKNEALITNTLASAAKDLVREFVFNYLYNVSLNYINKKDENNVIDESERKILARVYGAGLASSVIAWIEDDLVCPEHEFVIKLVTFFNDFPLDAIRHKGESNA